MTKNVYMKMTSIVLVKQLKKYDPKTQMKEIQEAYDRYCSSCGNHRIQVLWCVGCDLREYIKELKVSKSETRVNKN